MATYLTTPLLLLVLAFAAANDSYGGSGNHGCSDEKNKMATAGKKLITSKDVPPKTTFCITAGSRGLDPSDCDGLRTLYVANPSSQSCLCDGLVKIESKLEPFGNYTRETYTSNGNRYDGFGYAVNDKNVLLFKCGPGGYQIACAQYSKLYQMCTKDEECFKEAERLQKILGSNSIEYFV